MNELKITGTITKIKSILKGQKKDGSGEWEKQEFLVKTENEYNNLFCFEVFGSEKVANLTKYNKEGDNVTVNFNVNTNEWKDKHFTSLSAWKISKVESKETVGEAVYNNDAMNDQMDAAISHDSSIGSPETDLPDSNSELPF